MKKKIIKDDFSLEYIHIENSNYSIIKSNKEIYLYDRTIEDIFKIKENSDLENKLDVMVWFEYLKKDTKKLDYYMIKYHPDTVLKEYQLNTNVLKSILFSKYKPNIINFKGYPKTDDLISMKTDLEDYYKIKINKEDMKKYYFNYKTQRYEVLNELILGQLLENDFDLILLEKDITNLLKLFRKIEKANNNLIKFKNKCIDTSNDFKEVKEDSFTIKYVDYELCNIDEVKENTVYETTLKEILIPANNPKDDKLYIDCLQRLGSSFLRDNKYKQAPQYLGAGNNGRGILKQIITSPFQNGMYLNIRPDSLTEKFFKINLGATNILTMDELGRDSFKKTGTLEAFKDITGRGSLNERGMYTNEILHIKDYGVLWIFTNTSPDVDFSQKAYWNRTDLLKLPNTFAESEDRQNNILKEDINIDELLRKHHKEGVKWLIAKSIDEYRKMVKKEESFRCKQTVYASQMIYDGKNPIRIFIDSYVIQTGNHEDILTNEEIRYNMYNWMISQDINKNDIPNVNNDKVVSQIVADKLKNRFGPNKINESKTKAKLNRTGYRGFSLNIDNYIESIDINQELFNDFKNDIFN